MNIDCETGKIRIAVALDTPVVKTSIIKSLTTTTVRIEDNAVITGTLNMGNTLFVDKIQGVGNLIDISQNVVLNGSLVVNGTITAYNSNPFWIAGKVAANGTLITSKGRYGFSCSKSATGAYLITPDTAFGNTNYIVSLTSQVDTDTGYVRLNSSILSTSNFAVATSVGTVRTDCIFHFTVVN